MKPSDFISNSTGSSRAERVSYTCTPEWREGLMWSLSLMRLVPSVRRGNMKTSRGRPAKQRQRPLWGACRPRDAQQPRSKAETVDRSWLEASRRKWPAYTPVPRTSGEYVHGFCFLIKSVIVCKAAQTAIWFEHVWFKRLVWENKLCDSYLNPQVVTQVTLVRLPTGVPLLMMSQENAKLMASCRISVAQLKTRDFVCS